jgi:hypothetical protein
MYSITNRNISEIHLCYVIQSQLRFTLWKNENEEQIMKKIDKPLDEARR